MQAVICCECGLEFTRSHGNQVRCAPCRKFRAGRAISEPIPCLKCATAFVRTHAAQIYCADCRWQQTHTGGFPRGESPCLRCGHPFKRPTYAPGRRTCEPCVMAIKHDKDCERQRYLKEGKSCQACGKSYRAKDGRERRCAACLAAGRRLDPLWSGSPLGYLGNGASPRAVEAVPLAPVERACRHCQAMFPTTDHRVRLCATCRERRDRPTPSRACDRCGGEFVPLGGHQRRCSPCKEAEREARGRTPATRLACQRPFTVEDRRQRRCDECLDAARRSPAPSRRRKAITPAIAPAPVPVIVPPREFRAEQARVNAMAEAGDRLAGATYRPDGERWSHPVPPCATCRHGTAYPGAWNGYMCARRQNDCQPALKGALYEARP